MKWQGSLTNLLWFDSLSALTAGVVLLCFRSALADWLDLPPGLLTFQGVTNLVYASYGMSLVRRATRTFQMLRVLAFGNLAYAFLSLVMLFVYFNTSNIFGKLLFVAEILYVGGLGWVEWKFIQPMRKEPIA
ncbi:MAG: hypothetical protein IT269_03025 [Saprospiraceae bacterium]|nr:hypothetical protein [Saprospiraceae bacterium]